MTGDWITDLFQKPIDLLPSKDLSRVRNAHAIARIIIALVIVYTITSGASVELLVAICILLGLAALFESRAKSKPLPPAVDPDPKLRIDPREAGSRVPIKHAEATTVFSRAPQHDPSDDVYANVGMAKFVSRRV